MNPTASFKDTGMTFAASSAHHGKFRWVACASTGNTSASMAAYAAHGLPAQLDQARLQMVRNAVEMQGWHALALVACGIWSARGGGGPAHVGVNSRRTSRKSSTSRRFMS